MQRRSLLRQTYAGNVTRFYVYQALVYSYFWMPVWVFYLQTMRGMSLTQIYLLGTVSWVISAAAEVPTGTVADALGRRFSLAVGAAGYSMGVIGYALSTNFWMLALCGAVWTLGFSFISGADLAMVYDSLQADGRADDYTKVAGRGSAVMHAAQATASLIGAPLALVALNLPHIMSGVMGALAVIVALGMREPPVAGSEARSQATRRSMRQTLAESWRVAAKQREVRYTLLYYALTYLPPFLLAYIFLQPYAQNVGVPMVWIGALVLVMRGVSIAGSSLAPRVIKGWGETLLLYVIPWVFAVSTLGLGAVRSPVTLPLLLAVMFFGAINAPLVTTRLNDLVDSQVRATVLSTAALGYTLMIAISQPVLGWVADNWGVSTMLVALGTGFSLLIIAVLAVWRPRRQAHAAPASPALPVTTVEEG